ncbi:MAG: TatD family hydrolase [Proteobacteria bacterium]|nr:TatD family hydrolase [Pseudomonadota bacterium]
MTVFVDSHCHLSFPELMGGLDVELAAMQDAGVAAALTICTTMEEWPTVQALAHRAPNLWCSVGVHPDNEGIHEPTVAELVAACQDPKVVAVGETGLDYYRLNGRSVADMQWQRDRFVTHIEAARQAARPLIIHTRSASDDTLGVLREAGGEAAGGVFHCFTETDAVARAALDLGFYISLSGIVSFKNARDLHAVARWLPLDRLLIETDSPYLAPVPHRGKSNRPAWVAHVATALAALRGEPVATIAAATTANFERLFNVKVPQSCAAVTV